MSKLNSIDLSNLPNDLSNEIWKKLLLSNNIDVETLKKISITNKHFSNKVKNTLELLSHKSVKGFCNLRNIDNIVLFVSNSLFDFEQLNNILKFIEISDFINVKEHINSLKNLMKLDIKPSSFSIEVNNNTFVVFQLLKYHFTKNMQPFEIIDDALFEYFNNVYIIECSKTESTHKFVENLRIILSNQIEYTWHIVNFNVYYIYQLHRLFRENKKINMSKFRTFDKYIISYQEDTIKNSIKFIVQQADILKIIDNIEDNKDHIYILSYILFKLSKYIDNDTSLKIRHIEEFETYHLYHKIGKLNELFRDMLLRINDTISMKILE